MDFDKLKQQIETVGMITKAQDFTFQDTLLKTMEELGELARACLARQGNFNPSYRSPQNAQEVFDEVVDLFMCVISLIYLAPEYLKDINTDVSEVMSAKIEKWLSNLGDICQK